MNSTSTDKANVLLQELASTAQQYPHLSQQRQVALTKLVCTLMQSGRLCYPQRKQYSADVYEEIYNEALQELFLYICQNIHKYDSERSSVITWVNFLLERRFFFEATRKFFGKRKETSIADVDINNIGEAEDLQNITTILLEYINLDPENFLKNEHIREHPQANFQALAQQRISGRSWREIAAEYNLNISTLSSFYYRCINIYADRIRYYCQNYTV